MAAVSLISVLVSALAESPVEGWETPRAAHRGWMFSYVSKLGS